MCWGDAQKVKCSTPVLASDRAIFNLAGRTKEGPYSIEEVGVVQHARLGNHFEHKLTKLLTTVVNILRENVEETEENMRH